MTFTLNQSLHRTKVLALGELFLRAGKICKEIGRVEQGVLRGFVYDQEGEEITTHFYQEGDMVIGSYMPKTPMVMTIEALEPTELTVANYAEVMAWVNKDPEITAVISHAFEQLNQQLQSRLVALLNLTSVEKYERFLKDYPNLINRIPHYYIANFLGITPTQLSRARKQFINKCK